MKTGLITPCPRTGEDLYGKYAHLMCEYRELVEAWKNWEEEQKDKKRLADVVEEAIDLATSCMTLIDELEKISGVDKLADNALLMVAAKTYIRGYHSTPMI